MYKVILSFRYLFKRRISYLAFLAVALCVFIVVVVMTVMTGLLKDFKQKNHNLAGDCVVGSESLVGFPYYEDFVKALEGEDFIEGISPVIKSYALVNPGRSQRSIGVEVMGIEPVSYSRASGFAATLYYRAGDVSKAFEPAYEPSLPGCVVGIDLWLVRDAGGNYVHSVVPSESSLAVTCFPLTAKGALAKAGTDVVNTKIFYYSDTSQSGLARVDGSMIYLPFEQAQALCGMAGSVKRASAIHIKFKQGVKLQSGRERIAALWQKFVKGRSGEKDAELLEKVTVQSWKDYRREFIAAMEKEQVMVIFMFALVGITTVFIVFVVCYMIISHKRKDIGILKSIGVSNCEVMKLFSGFAFLLGALGSGLGVLLGWWFLVYINDVEGWLFRHFGFQLWDRTIYAIGDIPNQIEFKVVLVIILSAIAACLAGAILPSWQGSKLEPAETLQVSQL